MSFNVFICGKYENLHKMTKIQHISVKFNRHLGSVSEGFPAYFFLILLFSTVYNAKWRDMLLNKVF